MSVHVHPYSFYHSDYNANSGYTVRNEKLSVFAETNPLKNITEQQFELLMSNSST